ncbi:probable UDP-sugar transporter protein SLC35A5 [Branchiostoma floridae]|uniref:Probable UDP-sugar transporter protein SLC35A5 n=1 Tax=Branchiostoma floridae TaxID=7739 RepID=A0A9J7N6B6_BRAFL|nr:probable UDP-sugar transporter protein SLC35A5 [Branchiostoma floridae]
MKPFLTQLRPQRDTVTTVLLGAWFISLGVLKILFMKFSANEDGGYDYLPVTVSVCAEFLKLLVCGTIAIWVKYTEEGSFKDKFAITRHDMLGLLRWAVPGLLYFMDNLMQFYVITFFHPAMAVLLSNFVIITTSLLFRLVLKRVLTSIQWASLAVLFLAIVSLSSQSHHVGAESSSVQKPQAIDHVVVASLNHHDQICMVRQSLINNETSHIDHTSTSNLPFSLNMGHLLVIVQCFIASSANIYNEKIFKEGNGLQESIFIQNSKLYMFGVLFNGITPLIIPSYRRRLFECGFFYGHNSYSIALLFDVALFGLTVSIILKFRDNMFHVLGTQVTTVIVITSSIYLFHFVPTLQFFLTAPIVLLAVFIYNAARVKSTKTKHGASLVRTHDQEERGRPEGMELLPRQRHNSASKTSDEETEEEL